MSVEAARRAGWALLAGTIAVAWLLAAFVADVAASGIVVPPPQRLVELCKTLGSLDRYLAMAAGTGFLAVFLTWNRFGRNVPPWLRRLLPWRRPDLSRDIVILVGVTVAWGWSCVLVGSLLARTSPVMATAVVMILHAPLSVVTAPLQVIVQIAPMLVAVVMPLPAVVQLTVYWGVLGALLHMLLTSYGWDGRFLPRRRRRGRWD